MDVFNPVKMQKQMNDQCSRGRLGACVAAPITMPYSIFLGVLGAPLLIPIFMSGPNVQRIASPQDSTATSADMDAEPGVTELPEQDPASPGERP
jgi:hypothetical protein